MISVRALLGVAGVPSHRTTASKYLARQGIPTVRRTVRGGMAEFVDPVDLPEELRLAVLTADLSRHQLAPPAPMTTRRTRPF